MPDSTARAYFRVLDHVPVYVALRGGVTRAFVEVWKRDVRYHEDIGLSGSGLGLSIVKEVVERAGGHVEAQPAVTGGARFMFALPLCEAHQAG